MQPEQEGKHIPGHDGQDGQGVRRILHPAAVGDQEVVDPVEHYGRAQQGAGARHRQPAAPPHIEHAAADYCAADDVHGPRAEAAYQQKAQFPGSVLYEVADVFKCGEAGGYGQDRSLDVPRSGSNTSR